MRAAVLKAVVYFEYHAPVRFDVQATDIDSRGGLKC